jgi:hypothetical protein
MNNNQANEDKNNSHNQKNQVQSINDLSRFGHSVTLCKINIIKQSFI